MVLILDVPALRRSTFDGIHQRRGSLAMQLEAGSEPFILFEISGTTYGVRSTLSSRSDDRADYSGA